MKASDVDRADAIGQLQDLVANINPLTDPFLYYLPALLRSPTFEHIDATKALLFAKKALGHDLHPIVTDARKILNQLVNPHDGTLITPGPNIFYENSHFFWSELGGHTSALDIIFHVLNRTLFVATIGQ